MERTRNGFFSHKTEKMINMPIRVETFVKLVDLYKIFKVKSNHRSRFKTQSPSMQTQTTIIASTTTVIAIGNGAIVKATILLSSTINNRKQLLHPSKVTHHEYRATKSSAFAPFYR